MRVSSVCTAFWPERSFLDVVLKDRVLTERKTRQIPIPASQNHSGIDSVGGWSLHLNLV